MTTSQWFTINNVEELDSPALVIYKDRVRENIRRLIGSIDDVQRLRPHIKTSKSPEVSSMMMDAGISKFKCATIAEGEMLGSIGAPDVLLAYQPVGPKAERLIDLILKFPQTHYSCLIDNVDTAKQLSSLVTSSDKAIDVFIDLNVGMNRTGIIPSNAFSLFESCLSLRGINIAGLHAYDGHLRDTDYDARKKKCDLSFDEVRAVREQIGKTYQRDLTIVAGGTPTFSIHSKRKDVECSPGTFIYWDKGYEQILTEQQYLHAALVVTRVISKPNTGMICVDLGHKAIASENPLQSRVFFINATDLTPAGHSEEHMVFTCNDDEKYQVGDVFYGIPYHVCPTIALHDFSAVVEANIITGYWKTASRTRKITV